MKAMYKEKDGKTVSILGTDYKIVFVPDNDKRLVSRNADAITDESVKELVIAYFEPDYGSLKDLDAYQKKLIRHEIVHAFLFESGLAECSGYVNGWAQNEEMVDWIARQHIKMHDAFAKAGAL